MMQQADITILCRECTPRLQYVCDWIFSAILGLRFRLLLPEEPPVEDGSFLLAYGVSSANTQLYNCGLLHQQGIAPQSVQWSEWNNIPAFFTTDADIDIPFDVFSAVFFLISRYEEYTNHKPDKHNRFDARESILFQAHLLERPLADEWLHAFGSWLKNKGLPVKQKAFRFTPSYDIDIAWSYRHKGWLRNAGGYLRDLTRTNFHGLQARTQVLFGSAPDPYDSFGFLDQLHTRFGLDPLYFILAATQADSFDKNIAPDHPAMRSLIRNLSEHYRVGLHPSYNSSVQEHLLQAEQKILETTTGKAMTRSRQHYIRFRLPDTFRLLLRNGIREDYSMGYGTHPGFRAGTGNSFYWYDLEHEEATVLRITPFCFMDTTAHYELSLPVEQAFGLLRRMRDRLAASGSDMVTVFHNFSLGSDPVWKGWRDHYEQFIQSTVS